MARIMPAGTVLARRICFLTPAVVGVDGIWVLSPDLFCAAVVGLAFRRHADAHGGDAQVSGFRCGDLSGVGVLASAEYDDWPASAQARRSQICEAGDHFSSSRSR